MRAFVRTGKYLDPFIFEQGENRSINKYTDWNDAYYWPQETATFSLNGIVFGELHEFANTFYYSIEFSDTKTYVLKNLIGDELILSKNSDKIIYNGEHILLESPTISIDSMLNEKKEYLLIPLRCIAKMMGLYTYQRYVDEYKTQYLWLSESSILESVHTKWNRCR